MDWLTFDVVSRVMIPIGTFALGVIVTLTTKHIERKRAEAQEHVKAVAKLVNDWYNQLHQLSVDTHGKSGRHETKKAVYFYVHNRFILPALTLHLEYLRQRKIEPALVAAVEAFLALVTTFGRPGRRSRGGGSGVQCVDLISGPDRAATKPIETVLSDLDVMLQTISKLSAQALAK